jgi:hypothetical protein
MLSHGTQCVIHIHLNAANELKHYYFLLNLFAI